MSVKITAANLYAVASGASPAIVNGIVENASLFETYGISEKHLPYFFGQVAVETAGLTRLVENLYYTSTKRLMQVWPSRFKTAAAATPYVRNPEKLANNVYASRLGNGPPASGHGWKYRGRACKQTTGLFNYGKVAEATKLPVVEQPDLLENFPAALESACVFWRDNRLGRFADAGDVAGLTKAIQGGNGGLADRRIYTERALKVRWGEGAVTVAQPDHTAPTTPEEYPVLRMGMGVTNLAERPIIREAQLMLQTKGFEPGLVDGKFGGGTDNAVRALQEAYGLMQDGVIGKKTWALLMSEDAPPVVDAPDAQIAPVEAEPVFPRPLPPDETGMAGPMPPLEVDEATAARAQLLLTEKGYYEVGEIDADAAGKTQGAILAFKNENGLPLTPDIDDEFMAALEAAPKRYIPPERAEATDNEIMKKDSVAAEPVRQAWWQKAIAQVVGWFVGGGTIIYNTLGDAVDFLNPVMSILGKVHPAIWGVLIVAACFVVWFGAKRAGDKTADAYREGKVT